MMSQNERDRATVFGRVMDEQMTLKEAAEWLGVSYRQARRLWRRYRQEGDGGVVHRLRGRPSNNQAVADARRGQAVGWYREHYQGFGPTLASEVLAERHGLVVDHETLRGWLIAEGLWRAKREKRPRHRRRRERRRRFGELVQMDGSDHAWFGQDQRRCTLMVMVDDATNRAWACFFASETTTAAMQTFRGWVQRYGLPVALYPDRHGIYRRNDREAKEIHDRTGKHPPTQFGRAMEELGVKLICAHSPQAKGRVERMNGTFQDRLVKMLAVEGIRTIEAANAYLEREFLGAHNARFLVEAAEAGDAHRPAPSSSALAAALCVKEPRTVGKDLCVAYLGRCFQIEPGAILPRRSPKVQVREHLDGRVELWAAGERLACRELAQRPSPAPKEAEELAARVARHAPPHKPAEDHGWRKGVVARDPGSQQPAAPAESADTPTAAAAAVGGGLRSGRSRCAPPPSAPAPTHGKGTLQLG